jgi:hypothetical protein
MKTVAQRDIGVALGVACCLSAALLLFAGTAAARTYSLPPDEEAAEGRRPLAVHLDREPMEPNPYEAASDLPRALRVRGNRVVARREPTTRSPRRGVIVGGTRLPALDRRVGHGCEAPWYRVAIDAWVCGGKLEEVDEPPWGRSQPPVTEGRITPWRYAFVHTPDIEYRGGGGGLREVREVFKGFGFGVRAFVKVAGMRFFRTVEGRLVPRRSAGIGGRISELQGVHLGKGGPWPVGWVNSRRAWAYDAPSARREHRIARVERYTPFQVLEERGKGRRGFYRFDEGAWLRARDVRVTRDAPLPKGIEPGERWIDVDRARQIVTAYEGSAPVYSTLTSTGRAGSPTVPGRFRIWIKVAAIAMDNTDEELEEEGDGWEDEESGADAGVEEEEERNLYSLHDVPWTQFFHESFGLHGVYWHDGYGNRRSHGCVNLAPRDARWFFDWTRPRVPDGWWAINSSDNDPGTIVRVR